MRTKTHPSLIIVASGKGGIGKTTLTCAIAESLGLEDKAFKLFQVDDQDRLTRIYPGLVTTVDIRAINDTRTDPNALIRAFDPLFTGLESAAQSGVVTIVDCGATQQHALLKYAALIDLDEELRELCHSCLWLAPTTADSESMSQAVRTLATVRTILPNFRQIVALNERDGPFQFYPRSPSDKIWTNDLRPLCDDLGTLNMGRIEAGSWAPFESASLKFTDVVAASVKDIQSRTGVSRPQAKVMRGDVSAWLADMLDAIGTLFSGTDEEANHASS